MKDVATYKMLLDSLHDLIRMGRGDTQQADDLRERMKPYENGTPLQELVQMNAISEAMARRSTR